MSSQLQGVVLAPRDVGGYRMRIDRPQEQAKLARGALEGHVRTWDGGPGAQHMIAVTIQRFRSDRAARAFLRRERRGARGVTGTIAVPDIPGAFGLQTRKAGGMPDGGDAFGNVVVFAIGRSGVVLSHLGPTAQPPELLLRVAALQHRRLADA